MYANRQGVSLAGATTSNEASRNRVMSALPVDVLDRVGRSAIRVRLMHGQVLARADELVRQVHFVVNGLVCLVPSDAAPGPQLAMIGRDGGVGLLELYMGRSTMFAAAVVQIGGMALALRAEDLRDILEDSTDFSAAGLRSVHDLIRQFMENSASNACDTVIQRCARWLLMAYDRLEGGDLLITHGALAELLGVRRSGVTVALSTLLERGLVETRRGRISLRDPQRLQLLGGRTTRLVPEFKSSPAHGFRE